MFEHPTRTCGVQVVLPTKASDHKQLTHACGGVQVVPVRFRPQAAGAAVERAAWMPAAPRKKTGWVQLLQRNNPITNSPLTRAVVCRWCQYISGLGRHLQLPEGMDASAKEEDWLQFRAGGRALCIVRRLLAAL